MSLDVWSAFILYAIITCEIIADNSAKLKKIRQSNKDKLNDCQRCKILIRSWNHWLEKTSRGKFEGGDAAWEESKLKSYARSEIRLVEVQEGLCSELNKHQAECYSLLEEAEQSLEKWWFHEDDKTVDFHKWLCIDTLQYCCPQNHFGKSCDPCAVDRNDNICGGHGKCDGEGTREGNGTCICKRGYTGEYCEHCDKNYFSVNTTCKPCHKSCDGCLGEGAAACDACSVGWKLDTDMCIDIDECSEASSCEINHYCINTEGSYICKACHETCKTCMGPASTNCTSCNIGTVLWSGVCMSDDLKKELIADSLKRLVLYLGLFLISYFIFRKFKILASFVVIIIAVYIYYYEKLSKMNFIDVILNLYTNL